MAIFGEEKVYIIKDSIVLLHGNRYVCTDLYMANISTNELTVQPKLNMKHMQNLGVIDNFADNAYKVKVKRDLITYHHRCCFSPVVSTWIRAIENGNFCTWPGLTAHAVHKHLPKFMVTAKGHMRQQDKNVRSTEGTTKIEVPIDNKVDDGIKTGECYFVITPIASTGRTFSDQTGGSQSHQERGTSM